MRVVTSTDEVEISISSTDLISGKWLPCKTLTKKLQEQEIKQNILCKQFCIKFYNNCKLGKYNLETIANIKCIDAENPNKDGVLSSLKLVFVRG